MNSIKALRVKIGITQVCLAEKLGVSQACIAQWESGKNFPRSSELPALASALDCSINELFEKREG